MQACLFGSLLAEIKKEESHPGFIFPGAIPLVPLTADLEIQTSANGTDYIQFNVAVNKGFGEQDISRWEAQKSITGTS